ncbi:MAG: phosphoglucosamine mutase, partial [Clostridiales bacterium]|nr:phosphoglucosamine mutase [Clostridiales bacterium]
TDVGDRNVLELMRREGYNLGGEQSGHLIFLDDATTGDGQLAALRFLEVISQSGKKLSELSSAIPTYPQLLYNVSIEGGNELKKRLMEDKGLWEKIKQEQEKLGKSGRILVRPSGTEALIRIMVEATCEKAAKESAAVLKNYIEKAANSL